MIENERLSDLFNDLIAVRTFNETAESYLKSNQKAQAKKVLLESSTAINKILSYIKELDD